MTASLTDDAVVIFFYTIKPANGTSNKTAIKVVLPSNYTISIYNHLPLVDIVLTITNMSFGEIR